MKNSPLFLFGYRVVIITINLLLILRSGVLAQNSSYDANSVPIGGSENCAFGFNALVSANGLASKNVAIGYSAFYNSRGHSNTAIGHSALYNNWLFGNYNTGVGINSLITNTTGSSNTGLGALSDVAFSDLINATALGYGAIVNNSNSIQLGNSLVTSIYAGTGTTATLITGGLQVTGGTIATGNVLTSDASGVATWQIPINKNWTLTGNASTIDGTNFIGTTDFVPFNIRVNNQKAGRIDPSLYNTFYGLNSGNSNTTATGNTAIGHNALYSNVFVSGLTAIGYNALYSNKTGTNNTATGNNALYSNTTGSYNTANGDMALYSNTSGYYNTAIGYFALTSNTTGLYNTANGFEALKRNNTGNNNTAYGFQALNANSTGESNTASGILSLAFNSTGSFNTSIGSAALTSNTTGTDNTAIGYFSLPSNNTGSYNTANGEGALVTNITGNNNTGLGYYANSSTTSLTNATAIGNSAIVNANNKIRLGDATVTVVEGPVAYTVSDGRFKNNISEADVKGLDFINRLRPVVYNFDTKKFEEFLTTNMTDSVRSKYFTGKDFKRSTSIRQSGFIAQEVEKAAKESNYDFNGLHTPDSEKDNYSLAYGQFVIPLVKSVQELSSQNGAMKKIIDLQRSIDDSLRNEMEELRSMIKNILNTTNNNKEGSIQITGSNTKMDAKLFQNAPNPFNRSTIIKYSIPSMSKKATIIITNINGIKIKEFDVKKSENIEITGGQLSAGTYIYSLIVDDILVDSKSMILTH